MKISVITVCYNAADTLEGTMQSVLEQTYRDIEYIIIDGGSTDGTVDIIRKYEDQIAYWVSEPDKGIYDAMNKGTKVATGEWINFMNAGDRFYDEKVIGNLFIEKVESEFVCLFGDTLFCYKEKERIVKYGDGQGHEIMPSCHQSIFCRREIMLLFPFDLEYRIAADFAFFYQLKKMGYHYKYVDMIVAVYDASEGFSSQNIKELRREILKITQSPAMYPIICIWGDMKLFVKKILTKLMIST